MSADVSAEERLPISRQVSIGRRVQKGETEWQAHLPRTGNAEFLHLGLERGALHA